MSGQVVTQNPVRVVARLGIVAALTGLLLTVLLRPVPAAAAYVTPSGVTGGQYPGQVHLHTIGTTPHLVVDPMTVTPMTTYRNMWQYANVTYTVWENNVLTQAADGSIVIGWGARKLSVSPTVGTWIQPGAATATVPSWDSGDVAFAIHLVTANVDWWTYDSSWHYKGSTAVLYYQSTDYTCDLNSWAVLCRITSAAPYGSGLELWLP